MLSLATALFICHHCYNNVILVQIMQSAFGIESDMHRFFLLLIAYCVVCLFALEISAVCSRRCANDIRHRFESYFFTRESMLIIFNYVALCWIMLPVVFFTYETVLARYILWLCVCLSNAGILALFSHRGYCWLILQLYWKEIQIFPKIGIVCNFFWNSGLR